MKLDESEEASGASCCYQATRHAAHPRCLASHELDSAMSQKQHVHQFKVTLLEIEPRIWRRLLVPASYSFWDLHVAIQDSMGWLDYHLHLFRVTNPETGELQEIGIPDDDPFEDDVVCMPGWEIPVADYFQKAGTRAQYLYDFGDDWQHEVELEAILERVPKKKYPICADGARACPPEDCGGVPGYEDFLRIIADPTDEEYESMRRWLGRPYDPNAFDPKKVRFDSPKKRWDFAFRGA